MLGEYKDKILIFLFVSYVIFAVGSIAGSLYYVNFAASVDDIKNTLDLYVNSIKTGLDMHNITMTAMKNNIVLMLLLSITIFFRTGILLSVFMIVRKGFVTGFTVASIMAVYGIKGIYIVLISILQYTVIIPLMLMFCSVNTLYSARILRPEKKNIIFYLLFFIIILSIFCIEALIEGLFSTTFMKWLLNTVT